jgi:undecaprenyl pyrophosphate synthase
MMRTIRGKHVVLGLDGSRRHAVQSHMSASDGYRLLPAAVERATQRLLCFHEIGSLSVWLLQEYNLRRDPETVEVLVDIAVQCVSQLDEFSVSHGFELVLVGELSSLNQIRPGCLDSVTLRSRPAVGIKNDGTPMDVGARRIYLMLGYNHDKEFPRALARCAAAGVDSPVMSDLSNHWCIPPVNVLIRTGQPEGMVNLSAYWPGLERGRVVSTPIYPQGLTDAEIDRLVDIYEHGIDSSTVLAESHR